jgi:hypothetical protein
MRGRANTQAKSSAIVGNPGGTCRVVVDSAQLSSQADELADALAT